MTAAIDALAVWGPTRMDALVGDMITVYHWLLGNEWVFAIVGVMLFFHLLLKSKSTRSVYK